MRVGDQVQRRTPKFINSCGCRGCWLGHNQGEVTDVRQSIATVRFSFGFVEEIDTASLRVLDPVEALAEIERASTERGARREDDDDE